MLKTIVEQRAHQVTWDSTTIKLIRKAPDWDQNYTQPSQVESHINHCRFIRKIVKNEVRSRNGLLTLLVTPPYYLMANAAFPTSPFHEVSAFWRDCIPKLIVPFHAESALSTMCRSHGKIASYHCKNERFQLRTIQRYDRST